MMAEREQRPTLDPVGAAEFRRRRRGRNLALFAVLLAMVLLFYAISIVQMSR